MRMPSTATKMNAGMARTRTDRLRIDSAGGEAGSKIDTLCVGGPASSKGIATVSPHVRWAPLELPVAVQAAQGDGLVPQVVDRPDGADGAAAGAHEDRVRDRRVAGQLDARQQPAVADAGGAEDGALAPYQVVGAEDAGEVILAALGAQAAALLVVPRPAAQQHAAAQRLQG